MCGFPGGSVLKNTPANAGDVDLIPGSEKSPREGNCNPLQYSCLGNPTERGDWWAMVHVVSKKLVMTEQLNHSDKADMGLIPSTATS